VSAQQVATGKCSAPYSGLVMTFLIDLVYLLLYTNFSQYQVVSTSATIFVVHVA
jgi:hypothetical protein